MFDRVLVANRGEIAVRIIRTLRRLGVAPVAVYSDADAGAPHVRRADQAVRLGPAPARESYLSVERVVDAALQSGAQALHPGYGFLAENAELAEACAAAGVVFVGPPAAAIAAMGDKIRAKELVAAAGVPVVPGVSGRGLDDDALAAAALEVGLPVLLKPSAGGGGKGMRLVDEPSRLAEEIAAARREAAGAFGDDTLLVERFVGTPRHIEVQVLADRHGHVVHLGERECSLQRRHQKIVEEAPSPLLDDTGRATMGEAAVAVARACGYEGAGTVELIVSGDRPEEFFFMEMNTRLQVEHPVTEAVYGVDLVELQLRVAAGEPLPFAQDDLRPHGHAVEARVYAEDPATGFLPSSGTVLALEEPAGEGVRVDSGLAVGLVVGTDYDPMLAKVIAAGTDRAEAVRRLDAALAGTTVLGLATNTGFLRRLLADPDVAAGRLDTGLVGRRLDDLVGGPVPDEVAVAAALLRLTAPAPPDDPWAARDAWAPGGPRPVAATVELRGADPVDVVAVRSDDGPGAWHVRLGDGPEHHATLTCEHAGEAGLRARLVLDGRDATFTVAADDDGWNWLGRGGSSWATKVEEPWEAHAGDRRVGHLGPVVAPMPGTLVSVLVAEGEAVVEGQALAVVEAMKMEFTLRAPVDGVVSAVHAAAGRQVALGEPIASVEPHAGDRPAPAS